MIKIIKEQFCGLRIYEGTNFAMIRPLFWDKQGVDEVVVNYKSSPSPQLVKVAEEFQKKLTEKLVGKPQSVMIKWLEKEEFEEIR